VISAGGTQQTEYQRSTGGHHRPEAGLIRLGTDGTDNGQENEK
jgi:hypothetical protein